MRDGLHGIVLRGPNGRSVSRQRLPGGEIEVLIEGYR